MTSNAAAAQRKTHTPHVQGGGAGRFLRHASDVAGFYGFKPVRDVEKIARSKGFARRGNRAHSFADSASLCVESMYGKPGETSLVFYATPSPTYASSALPARDMAEFGLHVVGSPESVGEVLIIKTVATILNEWGARIERVRINCLGDRDSRERHRRELSLYVRRRAGDFSETCRESVHREPSAAYACTLAQCRSVLAEGPRPMTFLSEKSREHFREVLEHVERLGLPYEIDDLLAGDERDPKVLFKIDAVDDKGVIVEVGGGRFDDYLRRLTNKKEGATVFGGIYFNRKGADRAIFSAAPEERRPRVYFVQLGTRAKLQGLAVVDMLRHARIPVSQSFDTSHLGNQLTAARETGVSHVLIMGQREALDGTVIVRAMRNGVQTTVQLAHFPKYLRVLHP